MEPGHHGRRGDLLQQYQRGRARGHDDPVAGPKLSPRPMNGCSRADGTSRIASSALTVSRPWRCRQAGTAGRIGVVLRRLKAFDVKLHYTEVTAFRRQWKRSLKSAPSTRTQRSMVFRLRRGDDQCSTASRDRRSLRRDRLISQDEVGRLSREYRARARILQPRCDRPSARERPALPAMPVTSGSRSLRPRIMPGDPCHHGMTPHISGSSLSAEARYAAGAREILAHLIHSMAGIRW